MEKNHRLGVLCKRGAAWPLQAAARQGGGEWADRESTCHEVNNGNHKPMGCNSPMQQQRLGLNEKQRSRNGIWALVGRKLVLRQPSAPWAPCWSQLGKGCDRVPPPGTHEKVPASAPCPLSEGQQSPSEVVRAWSTQRARGSHCQ